MATRGTTTPADSSDSDFEALMASVIVVDSVATSATYESAVMATDALLVGTSRTFRPEGQKIVTNPAGLFEAFAHEAYMSKTLIGLSDRRLMGIGLIGENLAELLHARLQNNGLTAGDVKEPLSPTYVWRPILASQTGVIQSILIDFTNAAKARADAPDFRRAVQHWQRRYEQVFTANVGSNAALQNLADLFK